MKNRMIPSLTATMMLFARALSRSPSTSSHVMSATIANAGRLMRTECRRCAARCVQRRDVLRRRIGRRRRQRGREGVVRRSVVGGEPRRQVQPEMLNELAKVVPPRDRDGDVADRVLEDQIPADDPGDELAERRVRVRVRDPGLRNHRRELGVAQPGEAAGDRREQEREDERRSGAGAETASPDDRRADRSAKMPAPITAPIATHEMPRAERPLEPAAPLGVRLAIGDGFRAKRDDATRPSLRVQRVRLMPASRAGARSAAHRAHRHTANAPRLRAPRARCACRRTTGTRRTAEMRKNTAASTWLKPRAAAAR